MKVRALLAMLLAGVTLLVCSPVFGMSGAGAIVKQKTAGPYRIVLKIEGAQAMAMGHPKKGEMMLHGQMAKCRYKGGMAMGHASSPMMTCNHHIELHVYKRKNGKVVTTAVVTIVLIDSAKHMRVTVPIMAMIDAHFGMRDYHYGNNIYAGPGTYTVVTTVDRTQVDFSVHLL